MISSILDGRIQRAHLLARKDIKKAPPDSSHNKWKLEFSTKGIGTNLSYGTYEDARYVWASDSDSPRMEISRTSLGGCNDVKGTFTIYDAQFDYPYGIPRVTSFAASFEQYCGNKRSGLRGTIYFNALPVSGVR